MPIAIVRAAAKTSTGTQDFTVSGFGTPKAAFFLVTRAGSLENIYEGIVAGRGATDGTRNFASYWRMRDNQGTSSCCSGNRRTKCVAFTQQTANTIEGEAAFDSWITNGVRINWSTATSNVVYVTCILFGGAEISNVNVDYVNIDLAGTYDVTSVGFQPDLVLFFSNYAAYDNAQDYGHRNLGLADGSAGNQACSDAFDLTNQATTAVGAIIDTTKMMNATLLGPNVSVGSWDSSGFTLTLTNRAYGTDMMWLALKFSSPKIKIKTENWNYSTTGNKSFTGYGFKPNFLFILGSAVSSLSSPDYTTRAGPQGDMVVDANGSVFGNTTNSLDNADTSDERSLVSSSFKMFSEDNDQNVTASFVSYDSDGYTLNFSAVKNSNRYVLVLAVLTGLAISVSDTVAVTESLTVQNSLGTVSIFDSVTATENLTVRTDLGNVSVFDAAAVSEEAVVAINLGNVSIFDAAAVSEEVVVKEDLGGISIFDSAVVSESLTVHEDLGDISISDSAAVSDDAVVREDLGGLSVSDDVVVAEDATVAENPGDILVSDDIAVSEYISPVISLLGDVFVTEMISVTENTDVQLSLMIDAHEAVTVLEDVTLEKKSKRGGFLPFFHTPL